MNNTIKRHRYVAPAAELICLAPSAPIASWVYNGGSPNNKWNKNSWGLDFDLFGGASATGIMDWIDESTDGTSINKELDN